MQGSGDLETEGAHLPQMGRPIPLFCLIMCSSLVTFYFSLAESEIVKRSRQGWNHRARGKLVAIRDASLCGRGRSKGCLPCQPHTPVQTTATVQGPAPATSRVKTGGACVLE